MRNVLFCAAAVVLVLFCTLIEAPSIAAVGTPASSAALTGVMPNDPSAASLVAGSYDMMTRTAPFGMTIAVGRNCNVSGAYSHVEGFTTGGNITGKMIADMVFIQLHQSNGQTGDAVLMKLYDAAANQKFRLRGLVAQGGDRFPLNGWDGTKKVAAAAPKALDDVDVHAGPGGKYKVVGMMRSGAQAAKLNHHPDGWRKLRGVAAGGADGWVAEDHLNGC